MARKAVQYVSVKGVQAQPHTRGWLEDVAPSPLLDRRPGKSLLIPPQEPPPAGCR